MKHHSEAIDFFDLDFEVIHKQMTADEVANGLFGSLKKEGEQSRGRESNSISLFRSFLRNEGEGFGGVLTTSNPSFLIPPNWRDLEGEQIR